MPNQNYQYDDENNNTNYANALQELENVRKRLNSNAERNVQNYLGAMQNGDYSGIDLNNLTGTERDMIGRGVQDINSAQEQYANRGVGTTLGDIGSEVLGGVITGATGIAGFTTGLLDKDVGEYFYRKGNEANQVIQDNFKSNASARYKEAESYGQLADFRKNQESYNAQLKAIDDEESKGTIGNLEAFTKRTMASVGKIWKDIKTTATNVNSASFTDTTAQLAGMALTGGVSKTGIEKAGALIGKFASVSPTASKVVASTGNWLKTSTPGKSILAGINGMLMSGAGMNAAELKEDLKGMSPTELAELNPNFAKYLQDKGVTDLNAEDAQLAMDEYVQDAYDKTRYMGNAGVFLLNALFPGLDKALMTGKNTGVVKSLLNYGSAGIKDMAGEVAQEATEEAVEQVTANIGKKLYKDPNADVTEGVGENAFYGALGAAGSSPLIVGTAKAISRLATGSDATEDKTSGKKPSNTEPEVTSEDINNASKADTTNATYDDVKRDLFGDDSSEPNTNTQNDSTATNTQGNTNTQPEAEASSTGSTEQSEGTTDTETNTSTDNTQTTDTTEPSNTTESKSFEIGDDIRNLQMSDLGNTPEGNDNYVKVSEKWDQLPKKFKVEPPKPSNPLEESTEDPGVSQTIDIGTNDGNKARQELNRARRLSQVQAYDLAINGNYEDYKKASDSIKKEIARVTGINTLLTEDQFNNFKNTTVTEQTTNNTQTDNVEPSVETNTTGSTNTEPEVNTKPTEPTKQEKYRQLAKSKLQLNDQEKETAKKLGITDTTPTKVELFKALSKVAKDNPDNEKLAKELHRVGMDVIAGFLAYKKSKQTEELDQKAVQVASTVSMVENDEAFQKMDKVASEELIDNLDVSNMSNLNRPLEDSYDEKTNTLNVINTNKDTEEANQVSGTINSLFRAMSNGANLLNNYKNDKGMFVRDDSFNDRTGKISRLTKISQYTKQMKEAISRGTLVLNAEDSKKLEIISELADVQSYVDYKANSHTSTDTNGKSIHEIANTQNIQKGMNLVQKMIRSKDIGDEAGYTEAEDELKELVKQKLQSVGNKIKAWKDYNDKHSNKDVEYSADNEESYGQSNTNGVYARWDNKGDKDLIELKNDLTEAIKLNEMLNATRVFTDKVSVDLQSTPNKPKDVYMIPSYGSVGNEEYRNALGITSANGKATFDSFMKAYSKGTFNFLQELIDSASKLSGWKRAYEGIVSQESDELIGNKKEILRNKALIIKAIKEAKKDLGNKDNWNAYKILMHSLSTIGPVPSELLPDENYRTSSYQDIVDYVQQVNTLKEYPNVSIKDEESKKNAVNLVNRFLSSKGFKAVFNLNAEEVSINASQEELDQANAELINVDEGNIDSILAMFDKEYSDPSEFEQSLSSPKPSANEGANIVNPPRRNVEAEQKSSEGAQTLLNSTKDMGSIAEEGWYRYVTKNLKAKLKRLKGRLLQEKRTVDTLFGSAGLFQDKDLVKGNPLVNLFRNLKLRNVKEQSTYLVKALDKFRENPQSANIINIALELLDKSLLSDEEKKDIKSVLSENSRNITMIQSALENQLKEALDEHNVTNLFDMARYDQTKPYLL